MKRLSDIVRNIGRGVARFKKRFETPFYKLKHDEKIKKYDEACQSLKDKIMTLPGGDISDDGSRFVKDLLLHSPTKKQLRRFIDYLTSEEKEFTEKAYIIYLYQSQSSETPETGIVLYDNIRKRIDRIESKTENRNLSQFEAYILIGKYFIHFAETRNEIKRKVYDNDEVKFMKKYEPSKLEGK